MSSSFQAKVVLGAYTVLHERIISYYYSYINPTQVWKESGKGDAQFDSFINIILTERLSPSLIGVISHVLHHFYIC